MDDDLRDRPARRWLTTSTCPATPATGCGAGCGTAGPPGWPRARWWWPWWSASPRRGRVAGDGEEPVEVVATDETHRSEPDADCKRCVDRCTSGDLAVRTEPGLAIAPGEPRRPAATSR